MNLIEQIMNENRQKKTSHIGSMPPEMMEAGSGSACSCTQVTPQQQKRISTGEVGSKGKNLIQEILSQQKR